MVRDRDADRSGLATLLQGLELLHPVSVVTPGRPVQVQLHQVDTVQTELTQRRLAALGHPALGEHLLNGRWCPELVLRATRLDLARDERSRPGPGPKRGSHDLL